MKKIFIFSLVLVIAFAVGDYSVAAYEPVSVDIWAEVANGGNVEITAEVNCPLPEQSNIHLKDGETGAFHITFNQIGDYTYTIKVLKDDSDIICDKTVYTVKCYVRDDDGKLFVTTVIYDSKTGKKYEPKNKKEGVLVAFSNVRKGSSEITETTAPNETITDNNPTDSPKSHPKTGDEDELDLYLIICILTSASLFALSVSYYRSGIRVINQ